MTGLYYFTGSGEPSQYLNPFEAVGFMCAWLNENNLTTNLDLFWTLSENRRLTKANIRKWGKLAFDKLRSGRVRYSSLEVDAWMHKNKEHFEKAE